jgi:flagellar biosynthesis/type III secretory pathway chaperone
MPPKRTFTTQEEVDAAAVEMARESYPVEDLKLSRLAEDLLTRNATADDCELIQNPEHCAYLQSQKKCRYDVARKKCGPFPAGAASGARSPRAQSPSRRGSSSERRRGSGAAGGAGSLAEPVATAARRRPAAVSRRAAVAEDKAVAVLEMKAEELVKRVAECEAVTAANLAELKRIREKNAAIDQQIEAADERRRRCLEAKRAQLTTSERRTAAEMMIARLEASLEACESVNRRNAEALERERRAADEKSALLAAATAAADRDCEGVLIEDVEEEE